MDIEFICRDVEPDLMTSRGSLDSNNFQQLHRRDTASATIYEWSCTAHGVGFVRKKSSIGYCARISPVGSTFPWLHRTSGLWAGEVLLFSMLKVRVCQEYLLVLLAFANHTFKY